MNPEEQFFTIIQNQFFKNKKSLFIGELAWMESEEKNLELGKQTAIEAADLHKKFLQNSHFLTIEKDKSKGKYSTQKPKGKFDFIAQEIFTGLKNYYWSSDEKEFIKKPDRITSDIEIFNMLSDKGIALIVNTEFSFFNKQLCDKLNTNGFYLNGILGLPTSNRLELGNLARRNNSIFIVSRNKPDKNPETKNYEIFFADLSIDSSSTKNEWITIFNNFLTKTDSNSLRYGLFHYLSHNFSFRHVKSYVDYYQGIYINDEFYSKDVYDESHGLRKYISSIDYAPDIIEQLTDNHHGLFIKTHCEIDYIRPPATLKIDVIKSFAYPADYYYISFKDKVDSSLIKYIELFLCSDAAKSLRFIHLSALYFLHYQDKLEAFKDIFFDYLTILIPRNEEDIKQLVDANEKVGLLQNSIAEFQDGMNSNPDLFVSENINKIDDILEKMNLLNDADKIRALIRDVETNVVEFKESWRLPKKLREGQDFDEVSVDIEVTVFKVINSFLNTYGGELVIGIDDDTLDIVGIDEELKHFFSKSKSLTKKVDSFNNIFLQRLKYAFEAEFVRLIGYRAIEVDDKLVYLITCPAAENPCFFKKEFVEKYYEYINKGCSFYVREKDNTVCKKDKEQYEYTTRRWVSQPQSN